MATTTDKDEGEFHEEGALPVDRSPAPAADGDDEDGEAAEMEDAQKEAAEERKEGGYQ